MLLQCPRCAGPVRCPWPPKSTYCALYRCWFCPYTLVVADDEPVEDEVQQLIRDAYLEARDSVVFELRKNKCVPD
jgi:hypothetical protein